MGTTETSILMKLVATPMCVVLLGWLISFALKQKTACSAWLLVITLAFAIGLSDQLLRGSSAWWPADVTRRLPWFVLGAAILSGLSHIAGRWVNVIVILGRLTISGLVVWQLTSVAEPRLWWWSGSTALLFICWTLLESPLSLSYSWLVLGTWAMIAGVTGGVLVLSGSASLGMVSVSLGVALGTLAVFQLRWRHPSWQSISGIVSVSIFTLVFSGQQFAELPVSSGAILLVSLLSVMLLHNSFLAKRPWVVASTIVVATGLLTCSAAWLARSEPGEKTESEIPNPYLNYYRKK